MSTILDIVDAVEMATKQEAPPTVHILIVRFKRGLVGETKRVVHMVPVSADIVAMPDVLVAFCGTEIGQGQADLLDKPSGMPCTACLSVIPRPWGGKEAPASSVSSRGVLSATYGT